MKKWLHGKGGEGVRIRGGVDYICVKLPRLYVSNWLNTMAHCEPNDVQDYEKKNEFLSLLQYQTFIYYLRITMFTKKVTTNNCLKTYWTCQQAQCTVVAWEFSALSGRWEYPDIQVIKVHDCGILLHLICSLRTFPRRI